MIYVEIVSSYGSLSAMLNEDQTKWESNEDISYCKFLPTNISDSNALRAKVEFLEEYMSSKSLKCCDEECECDKTDRSKIGFK